MSTDLIIVLFVVLFVLTVGQLLVFGWFLRYLEEETIKNRCDIKHHKEIHDSEINYSKEAIKKLEGENE
jgi:hypothetical protein